MVRRDDDKRTVLARAFAAEGRKEALARLTEDHDCLGVLMGSGNERSKVRSLGRARRAARSDA